MPASRQRSLDLCLSGDGFGVLLEVLTAERDALAVEVGESIARGDGVADGRSIQLAVDATAAKAHRRARCLTVVLDELRRIQRLDRHTIVTLTQVTHANTDPRPTESGG